MANWPRTIDVVRASPLLGPEALKSWGVSGKGQFRSPNMVGWAWEEEYVPFDATSAAGRAFLADILNYFQSKTTFTIDHPAYRTLLGAGGGTPLVNGASQTGNSLATDGWPNSTTVLKKGDLFKIAITGVSLVRMVLADVVSNGSGQATITLTPGIPSGGSPSDNAAIVYAAPCYITAVADEVELSEIESHKYLTSCRVHFREQPS